MNEQKLEQFRNYLSAVVEHYRTFRSLKNFSKLSSDYKCAAITRELFFQFELDKLPSGNAVTRELSDKIRLLLSEQNRELRRQMLEAYLEEHQTKPQQSADAKPDIIPDFDRRASSLCAMLKDIGEYAFKKMESMGELLSPLFDGAEWDCEKYDVLKDWSDYMECVVGKKFVNQLTRDDEPMAFLRLSEEAQHVMMSFLLCANADGAQHKFNFDARGYESVNDELDAILKIHGFYDNCAFHKFESWKGCGHLCVVYDDAPDVLMIVGDGTHSFYTIEDDIFYSYCGDTIINPNIDCHFGGWGTRSLVAECMRTVLTCHGEAVEQQRLVPDYVKGKLMDDLNHYDDIRAMYREDWKKKQEQQLKGK